MSDANNNSANSAPPGAAVVAVPHRPFPAARLLFTIGYGFIAYFVLHVLFVLVAVQFLMFVINGRVNDELKSFSASLARYVGEILAYMVFARDEQPFPFGDAFPKSA